MGTNDGDRAGMERLERAYEAAPRRYRLQLLLLAGLGHAVLVIGLLCTVGLLVAIGLQLWAGPQIHWEVFIPIMVLAATSTVLLRAVWLKLEPPAGHRLEAGQAPRLQAEIERIRQAIGAARLEGIFIDAELNAGAVYVPRMAGLAGGRPYLVLGLPLMQLLDADELAAVIAHEFGHFHGGDGRFSAWIYRVRVGWQRVARSQAVQGFASQLPLLLFLRWYVPRLEARSQVVARQQEFAADAMAARIAGAQAAAGSLLRLGLAHEWLEHGFWPDVARSGNGQACPPILVYRRLGEVLAAHRIRPRRVPARLLLRQPGVRDTHPTLARRLRALGVAEPATLQANGQSAAEAFLEPALREQLEERFSRQWQEAVRPTWAERHRLAQAERARLEALAALPARDPGQTLEYALLLEVHHRDQADQAVDPLYSEVLRALPAHPLATGRLGLSRLRQGRHVEGSALLRRALALDATLAGSLSPALRELQVARPEDAGLETLDELLEAGGADATPAGEAMLVRHALSAEQLEALVKALSRHERIAMAWIACRASADPLAPPHHLLLIHWKGSVASEAATLPRLAAQLEGSGTFVVLGTSSDKVMAGRIRAAAGAPVHRRP